MTTGYLSVLYISDLSAQSFYNGYFDTLLENRNINSGSYILLPAVLLYIRVITTALQCSSVLISLAANKRIRFVKVLVSFWVVSVSQARLVWVVAACYARI